MREKQALFYFPVQLGGFFIRSLLDRFLQQQVAAKISHFANTQACPQNTGGGAKSVFLPQAYFCEHASVLAAF